MASQPNVKKAANEMWLTYEVHFFVNPLDRGFF
jgi:hypothetical protein